MVACLQLSVRRGEGKGEREKRGEEMVKREEKGGDG